MACAHFYFELGRSTEALFVDYGQLAGRQEHKAAKNIADHLGIPFSSVSLVGNSLSIFGEFTGRNLYLVSTALFVKPYAKAIALGIHGGTDYIDCSSEFVEATQGAFNCSTKSRTTISTPFLEWHKKEVWTYATENKLPIELTYSCETGGELPCEKCPSCLERRTLIQ